MNVPPPRRTARSSSPGHPHPTFKILDSTQVMPARDIHLDWKPPTVVKEQSEAFRSTAQTSTMVSAFFTLLSGVLFAAATCSGRVPTTESSRVLLWFRITSYAAMMLNVFGSVASLCIVDLIGDLTLSSSRRQPPTLGILPASTRPLQLLRRYGAPQNFPVVFAQWVIYLLLGIGFMLAQLILLVWIIEGLTAVSIVLTCICSTAGLSLFLSNVIGGKSD
ncbi:unnamed protein product [Mycena citricolor]|uniref:Uncharacterized protein n=1 Tax=Mycena citricolor TaxID=2018698 RepID=A0AAD2K472_9AGAR|nr:unnamed protein product [Mycena citricolor]